MNQFLNDNWYELQQEMRNYFEESASILVKHLIQQFLNRVRENQLLLD